MISQAKRGKRISKKHFGENHFRVTHGGQSLKYKERKEKQEELSSAPLPFELPLD